MAKLKVSIKFRWYDMWRGVFVNTHVPGWAIYICLIPCFPIKIWREYEYYEELDYPDGRPPREGWQDE